MITKENFKLEFDKLVSSYLTNTNKHTEFEYFFGMLSTLMNDSEAELLRLYKAIELIYPDYFKR
jgi:hypothetical protein